MDNVTPSPEGAEREIDTLPQVEMMPTPERLYSKPPYFLTMAVDDQPSSQSIRVECSHRQSLDRLLDWLSHWKQRYNESTSRENVSTHSIFHSYALAKALVVHQGTNTGSSQEYAVTIHVYPSPISMGRVRQHVAVIKLEKKDHQFRLAITDLLPVVQGFLGYRRIAFSDSSGKNYYEYQRDSAWKEDYPGGR